MEETPNLPSDNISSISLPRPTTPIAITIVVIVALIFFYPLGVILMWFLTKWPRWAKILITLLLILPIIAIAAAIALLSLNPARQFSQANDSQRKNDVNVILNGISQIEAETGALPTSLQKLPPGTKVLIQSSNPYTGPSFCSQLVPTYVAELPKDPSTGSFESCNNFNTGYLLEVGASQNGSLPVITISAIPQLAPSISVSR